MRILQIVHGLPPEQLAGTEIYCYELSHSLSRQRSWILQQKHQVFIFYRITTENKPYKVMYRKKGLVHTFGINTPWKDYHQFNNEYQNRKVDAVFYEILRKVKPDIVHIHHLIGLSATIPLILKEKNIPYIMTLHDFWYLCRRGQLARPDMQLCYHIDHALCPGCFIDQDEADKLEKVKKRDMQMKTILQNASLLISPSKFLRQYYIKEGVPKEQIIYLDNGINTKPFKNFKRTKSKKTRFGFIGTFIETKGVHVLIEAFKILNNPDTELHLFGFAPSTAKEYMNMLEKQMEGVPNIYFHGKFPPSSVANVFAQIDCLVIPSLWFENSPLTIHEAMLTGTPVIASNLGGMAEYVKEGRSGLLFEVGNAHNFRSKIEKYITLKIKFTNIKFKVADMLLHQKMIVQKYKQVCLAYQKKEHFFISS